MGHLGGVGPHWGGQWVIGVGNGAASPWPGAAGAGALSHWGRLRCIGVGYLPAPVGGFLPRCRGWSREGSAVGLAAGGPGHQARLVGPVAGNGVARGSCGRADGGPGQPTAPPGAPGEGNAAALVCPSDMERAVLVHQDPRSTVEPPCPRAPEPGGAITGTRLRPRPAPDPQQLGAPASTSDSQPAATSQPAPIRCPTSAPASKATRRQQWGERTANPTPWFLITHRIGPSHSSEVQS